jgi:hypothetical protein
MPDRPLLILPRSVPLPRITRPTPVTNHYKLPRREEQGARIGPQLTSMLDAFVSVSPAGTSTENVLVLETIGRPEGFHSAVAAVPGLKWIAEFDIDDVEADAQFFERPKIGKRFFKNRVFGLSSKESSSISTAFAAHGLTDSEGFLREEVTPDEIRRVVSGEFPEYSEQVIEAIDKEKSTPLPGRMYLSLSNRQALQRVKNLFDSWERRGRLEFGAGAWGDIFSHLRTIRFWDTEDRVRDTGILDYWEKEVELKRGTASNVSFEIEFSYEESATIRLQKESEIVTLVAIEGGRHVASCHIPQIKFHAIKVEVPVDSIERVLGGDYGELFRNGDILYFRPTPQCSVDAFPEGVLAEIPSIEAPGNPPINGIDLGSFPPPFSIATL